MTKFPKLNFKSLLILFSKNIVKGLFLLNLTFHDSCIWWTWLLFRLHSTTTWTIRGVEIEIFNVLVLVFLIISLLNFHLLAHNVLLIFERHFQYLLLAIFRLLLQSFKRANIITIELVFHSFGQVLIEVQVSVVYHTWKPSYFLLEKLLVDVSRRICIFNIAYECVHVLFEERHNQHEHQSSVW